MVLKNLKRIRNLTGLILSFLVACSTSRDSKESIAILWKDNRAVAITIPKKFISETRDDSLNNTLTVHLRGTTHAPAILGEYFILEDRVRFEPLIPFTRKSSYEVRLRDIVIDEISIPAPDDDQFPVLLGIFPTQDTLPQNVLKFYFLFSKPMREGQSLQHVFLLKDERDTITQAFLDLQPELWNEDRTMLTLWLDPGRIKRDLQPNKMLGEPLQQNVNYQVVVNDTWADIHGVKLKNASHKKFYVSQRDTLSPSPDGWTLATPRGGTREPLQISFHKNLDYALLNSSITIIDKNDNEIKGKATLEKEESVFKFFPEASWTIGQYTIRCDSRLEDLSGNNLNRPFDRDIAQKRNQKEQNFFLLEFNIR